MLKLLSDYSLIVMLFMHIVDDYHLQRALAKYKQREWWRENFSDRLYKYDYITALILHSFSWTFCIMIVPMLASNISKLSLIGLFAINTIIHAVTDHIKCNELLISLTQDQLIHIFQVIVTWSVCFI